MPPITDPTSKLLAYRIREARKSFGWTLADFAAQISAAGTWSPSASQMSMIETCNRSVSVPELHAIADALVTSADHLMRKGSLCEACGQEIPK